MRDITQYFEDRAKCTVNIGMLFLTLLFGWFTHLIFKWIREEPTIIFPLNEWIVLTLLIPMIYSAIRHPYHISGISDEYNLFSLKSEVRTKKKISGSFILGCGSVSGSEEQIDYYIFFKEGEFGLIKQKLEARNIEVIQTNKVSPSYKEIWIENKTRKFIFVPKHTIRQYFKIDT